LKLQVKLLLAGTLAVVLVGTLVGCNTSEPALARAPAAGAATDPDKEAITLEILDYQGIRRLIDRHRGKVVVVDAWSTSCPPCRRNFHHLVDLHRDHGRGDVACVSLSFDYEGVGTPLEQKDRVLGFLRGQQARFDNILSSEASDQLYKKLRLASVPAVFVYDRAGKLRKRFDNEAARSKAEAFSYAQVRHLVEELLKERPGSERSGAENATATQPAGQAERDRASAARHGRSES